MIATILSFCSISYLVYGTSLTVYAQSYLQTIKDRNLIIDLGNGVKTNGQLTYPAVGKGPFPGVLLIQGSGAVRPLPEIAPYLSERGFAVLQYDKRGVGENFTILDTNVWGNATINDFIHDAEKAVNVLTRQPEVDPQRISIIGHSEGTIIAPRIAIDNLTKVKNIVLMGAVAQNYGDLIYYLYVNLPTLYAKQVLDQNHTGLISIEQIAKDPLLIKKLPISVSQANNTKAITDTLAKELHNNTNGYISIDKQLKPLFIKVFENDTSFNSPKCSDVNGCPIWYRSAANLEPTLSIIGNVSKSTGILILNGQNDSQTPVQQALLLQQRLTEVNHPDHMLITYPNLGHLFYPSSQWSIGIGPIQPYVLSDLYSWLESHSGFTRTPTFMPSYGSALSSSTNSTSK